MTASAFVQKRWVGAAMMCVGVACLGINDAMAKSLAGAYSPLQILFLRNVIALPFALGLALVLQGKTALRSYRPATHLIRGLFWVLATFAFFTSITHLGLAKSTALIFVAPLIVAVVAVLFLGETADLKRWSALVLGFLGALIVIRPGAGDFEPLVLLPLVAALMAAFLMLSARLVDERETVWTLLLYLTGASALVSASVVWIVWVPVQMADAFWFAGVAVFGTAGMVLITQAFRVAPAVLVAPLDYTALVWATLLGWLFWSEVPDTLTFVGAGVIVVAGVMTMLWAPSEKP